MSEEFESIAPDLTQLLAQRMASKASSSTPTTGFDPHKVMLNRKKSEEGLPTDTSNSIKWPEKDIKTLEEFCTKHGIVGFNCGMMSPIAALSMLKSKMGIVDGPLDKRIPIGYESIIKSGKSLLKG